MTEYESVVPPFDNAAAEAIGESKLNCFILVPTVALTVRVAVRLAPYPFPAEHKIDVPAVQLVVPHGKPSMSVPKAAVGVITAPAKFNPSSVMGVPPVVGELGVPSYDKTGASNVKVFILVPTIAETVTCGEFNVPSELTYIGSWHNTAVSEDQTVVWHTCTAVSALYKSDVGVESPVPKLNPCIVRVLAEHAGMLS